MIPTAKTSTSEDELDAIEVVKNKKLVCEDVVELNSSIIKPHTALQIASLFIRLRRGRRKNVQIGSFQFPAK